MLSLLQLPVCLLAADFTPEVWVSGPEQRELRLLLEYHTRPVQLRTRLKNTVHAVLVRNGYQSPASDLSGRRGRSFFKTLTVPQGETMIIQSALGLTDALDKELKALDGELCARAKTLPEARLLLGVPGLDLVSINDHPVRNRRHAALFLPQEAGQLRLTWPAGAYLR